MAERASLIKPRYQAHRPTSSSLLNPSFYIQITISSAPELIAECDVAMDHPHGGNQCNPNSQSSAQPPFLLSASASLMRQTRLPPGGTGVEQSTEGQGATNKDTTTNTPMGAKAGSPTGMQPGTGVEDSVQGEGATNKQGVNETKPGNGAANMGGASAGNAAGGTGVETSSQGEGSQNKTSK